MLVRVPGAYVTGDFDEALGVRFQPPELGQNVPVRTTQATGDRPIVVVLDGGPLDGKQFTEIGGANWTS